MLSRLFDNAFELEHLYDIKVRSGKVDGPISANADVVIRVEANDGGLIDSLVNSRGAGSVDVAHLIESPEFKVSLIFQAEGKAAMRTGFFSKGKAADVVSVEGIDPSGRPVLSRKGYRSFQAGYQEDDQRTVYLQWTSLDPTKRALVIVFRDDKLEPDESIFLFPSDWVVGHVKEVKVKRRLKIYFDGSTDRAEHPASGIVVRRNVRPYTLYAGLALLAASLISAVLDWPDWFFGRTHGTAAVVGLITCGIGLSTWTLQMKNAFVSLGFLAITVGGTAWWQGWTLPVLEDSYHYVIGLGLVLLVLGTVPGLIGYPLLIAGAWFALTAVIAAVGGGLAAVPVGNVVLALVCFLVGWYLAGRQKRLEERGWFRSH